MTLFLHSIAVAAEQIALSPIDTDGQSKTVNQIDCYQRDDGMRGVQAYTRRQRQKGM